MEQLIEHGGIILPRAPDFSPHHSVPDWDWHADFAHILDTVNYVVAPSSLRAKSDWHWPPNCCLSNKTNTQDVVQGQISAYIRAQAMNESHPMFTWRNQATLGTANTQNCYIVHWSNGEIRFNRITNGVRYGLPYIPKPHANNTWYYYRLTWWMDGTTMRCQIHRDDGAGWYQVGSTIDIANALWTESGINRVGHASYYGYPTKFVWFDETRLYGVSP